MSRFKDNSSRVRPRSAPLHFRTSFGCLLFFFMVTTVMREVDLSVKVTLPEATETTKLEDKALVDYIYIGPPQSKALGTEPLMQLNDQFARSEEIDAWVKAGEERRDGGVETQHDPLAQSGQGDGHEDRHRRETGASKEQRPQDGRQHRSRAVIPQP